MIGLEILGDFDLGEALLPLRHLPPLGICREALTMAARDRVRINVGGTEFVTTATTIANAGCDSMLSSLLDENWQLRERSEELFIDRNPAYFSVLLDLLRTGELRIPPDIPERSLFREALFYGLVPHVKAARWASPLDGNRIECRASIPGRAMGDATAIRASPGGGCCVAHGCMVHVYDWAMEEQQPLSLDFVNVNDLGFLSSGSPERLVVCTYERSDEIGGMGCFNASTGRLEHRFRLLADQNADSSGAGSGGRSSGKNFTALAAASSDVQLFASCRGRSANGIGIWDQHTGQNVGFLPSAPSSSSIATESWSFGNACKLQWLPSSNLLLAASMYPQSDHCFLMLLDLRQKSKAWEWTDAERRDDKVIMDGVAIESGGAASSSALICVVNQYDNLGFIDARATPQQPVKWSYRFQQLKLSESEEHSYSKLRANSGSSQLFSSHRDAVLVYSCSAWGSSSSSAADPTSRLVTKRSGGGAIADFDIGGDRLFVLHSEEDVFDVWETPVHCGIGSVG